MPFPELSVRGPGPGKEQMPVMNWTVFLIEAVVLCAVFHLTIYLIIRCKPELEVYSYPPAITQRWFELGKVPQKETPRPRERIRKKAPAALIIGILLWRVLPVFRRVLESLGIGSSGSGSALMRVGTAAGWIVLALIGLVVIAAVVILALMRTKHRAKVIAFLKNACPPVRRVAEKLSSARVAGILGLMLSSGFPMENALEMAPAALTDEEAIAKVNTIREHMLKDETFSEALAKSGLFADFHNRMLKVGAVSGHEPQVMTKIAEIYEEQVEDGISRLVSIIEPTLIALLAVVIGAVLLSVMLPMAGILSSML